MNHVQKKRVEALRRRADLLERRLSEWTHGDPNRTAGERSALLYAIQIIETCDSHGILNELEARRGLGPLEEVQT